MDLGRETAAIVSGGASGLGEATARRLAARGVKVVIFDQDKDKGERVAAEIGGLFCAVDVSEAASVRRGLAEARQAHGVERICVSCAGIAPPAKTVGREGPHDADLFQKVLAVNLMGTFNLATQSAAAMSKAPPLNDDGERGLIINTASVAAFEGQIGQIAYAASKGGVASMTLPMARDLASLGIRVLAIAPGLFATPMLQAMKEELREALAEGVPFPSRLGAPDEFAALVLSMAENAMLNGETIRLDGAIRMPPKSP